MNTEPAGSVRAQAETQLAALESRMAPLFEKAPHLPVHARETIASIAPWIALIVGVLGILAAVPIFSSLFFVSSLPYAQMMAASGWYPAVIVALFFLIASSILNLLAYKPLSMRKKKGWNLMFYGVCLSVLSAVVNLFFGTSGLSGIIGAIIGFWLLFEVREFYKA